ncbi:MAG: hypothetical protein DWQ37_21120 [Planctomycetota bacterium]|nr:MAG: hypothetical protein DWQ37_21120 [Planctomycetota bacterium]
MNPTQLARGPLPADSLLGQYKPPAGVYDELVESDGTLRPQWREFLSLLDGLGGSELERRWDQARRLIHENGITYNVHGDPQGRDRRWELDALPLVLAHSEWSQLASGLEQRARLLNAILADLYGPQQLLAEGLLPAELVFAHPGFLRPCHGYNVPEDCHLHLYAAHLARSPEGNWWVVADRSQAAVGPGYAVENRIVISRMLPHIFHHCRVQRLAGFFIALREQLGELARRHREQPQIVLLSPGPSSMTYFEDAYLSRYLGYTLVEGEDLTVRDNRVFLKTLGGLMSVDAVLRRVMDDDCDPLELNTRSRVGVPGLVHAARSGNVVVANALGSGLVEAPALMAFLPEICRRLLGEELRVPSVRTWWCGDESSRRFVLSNLERLVVGPAFLSHTHRPVHAATLDRAERQQLAAEIEATPGRFVAQELVVRSTAPVWNDAALHPGHIALRAFVVASEDSYQLMPGALAHVSSSASNLGESLFVGHGSKDVWVLSDGPVAPVTLLQPPGTPLAPRRSGVDLPSRVADNLFWLGRHVERAEGTARLLRSVFSRLISEAAPGTMGELALLYRALCGPLSPPEGEVAGEGTVSTMELLVMEFLYDEHQPGSLQSILSGLGRVAKVVRDRISLDSWRILMRVDDDFRPKAGAVSPADVLAMLNQMILNFSAFAGVATENMTRGPGWQFLELGRRIERALILIGVLRSTLYHVSSSESAVLEALLEIADSSMTYRNRYATNLQLAPVLDLLLTDETNPRAIAFQLAALTGHVERLPRSPGEPLLSDEQRLVLAVLSAVRLADVQKLAEADEHGVRHELDALLQGGASKLRELASAVSHKYLVHAGPAHQLTEIRLG